MPVVVVHVLARAVHAAQARAEQLARTDALTGVLNRQGMGESAAVIGSWNDAAAADAVAERLLAAVEQRDIPGLPRVTISIGTASVQAVDVLAHEPSEVLACLVDQADQGLYQAKHAGRNRFCRSSGPAGAPSQSGAPGARIGA
ncbi:Diguanylate cyclase, GGDEF domain [Quadrisphaera granulorum]|uniref:Diguanylate cyclase with GGDEF domain n=1 Tax=Quadrisphaera granulorum TaxID=317664 RepID=A0A316AAN2_9ACTN|nr:diguanylate cyclase [Quadrisphaera granulorum]PWJ54459.1 diguanylate cyclase with GGDEF domain [Quadrisphaera granulorum]SZE96231.1 Diguanylate cyclase, GGDEF domain [Quadrisphaera granulorum]